MIETIDTFGDFGELAGVRVRQGLSKAKKLTIICTVGAIIAIFTAISGFFYGLSRETQK